MTDTTPGDNVQEQQQGTNATRPETESAVAANSRRRSDVVSHDARRQNDNRSRDLRQKSESSAGRQERSIQNSSNARCGESAAVRDSAQRPSPHRDRQEAAKAGRLPRSVRSRQDANGSNGRSASYRTPAALTTMSYSVEATLASRRNAKNGYNANNAPEPKKRPDGRVVRQPFNGEARLYEVIQVRLSRTQRLVEVNTNGIRLGANTPVLIRFHRNVLMATTVGCRYRRVAEINVLAFVVRVANEEDLRIDVENAAFEKRAYELASEFAIAQNLQMKVLSTDLSHDHKNVTVNFASDVRVDFREMVAYLASKLKMRVEMFQLGLRNGTGLICGLGSCGQLLCCGRFLGQFDPVAVRQIRAQGMASNPKRISGVCGRLYCCMSYEYCDYTRDKRNLPKKGKRVMTRWGIGRVSDIDMIREEIVITYDNGEVQRMTTRDYVSVSEDILSDIESGKIEFPIERARFYLNADPSAAYESKPSFRMAGSSSLAPQGQSKKVQASARSSELNKVAKKSSVANSPPPQQAERSEKPSASSQRSSGDGARNDRLPKQSRRTQGREKKPKLGIAPNVTVEPDRSAMLVPTPVIPAQSVPHRKLSHGKSNRSSSMGERAPRKVKARQPSGEESASYHAPNLPHSSRRSPLSTSNHDAHPEPNPPNNTEGG